MSRLARELRMESIAEGIEEQQHARSVLALGVEYGQGFYYAAAMPLTVASRFIRRKLDGRPGSADSAA